MEGTRVAVGALSSVLWAQCLKLLRQITFARSDRAAASMFGSGTSQCLSPHRGAQCEPNVVHRLRTAWRVLMNTPNYPFCSSRQDAGLHQQLALAQQDHVPFACRISGKVWPAIAKRKACLDTALSVISCAAAAAA